MLLFGCEGVQDAAETHFFDSRKTATILILDWAPFLLDDICSPTKLCKGSKGIFQSNTLGNPMLAAHMLPASLQIELIVLLDGFFYHTRPWKGSKNIFQSNTMDNPT